MSEVSRRSFIGIGASAAALAAFGLAGCAPKQASSDSSSAGAAGSAAGIEWGKETDVAIVGYGGAGAAAAIEAKRAGAEVIVLEETAKGGGSTAACGGFIMMGGTPLQKKFGIEESVDNFYEYLCAAGGENANKEAIRVLADNSPALYDWCVECGMDFESGQADMEHHLGGFNKGISLGFSGNEMARDYAAVADPVPHGHLPQPSSSGQDIFKALSTTVESLGIDVLFETPVRRLVVDGGRVVGVIAESPDGELAVKARKGVILAAGGFTDNDEMVAACWPYPNERASSKISGGNENGSGIAMGLAIGAATRGLGDFQIGAPTVTMAESLANGILIDEKGRRIVAEDEYNSFMGKAITLAPTSTCYLLIDPSFVQDESAQRWAGEYVTTAASVEEAATATGIAASVLARTIDFYNRSVEEGADDEFGKDARFLATPIEPPFDIYKRGSAACNFGSCGGLKIDLDARVLDTADAPIPGLYAAGRNAGSIYGWYMGSGSSMADVLTFGRIAGKSAASESSAE